MATQADWIRVELSEPETQEADRRAALRQEYARSRGFRRKGCGSLETDKLGSYGEMAVAKYESVPLDVNWTWEADLARGHDVAGWQVRCRGKPRYGLPLNPGDTGRYLMTLGHEVPVMWLVGWIDADAGFEIARPRSDYGHQWWLVEQDCLHPLPEQNGYTRRGSDRWLLDPQTPFWCETCGGTHPIAEHRQCRITSPAP